MSNLGRLSNDLLVEVLTRLPLKPLYRFKCVSKSWQSLISDDYLRNRHHLIVSGVFQHGSEISYISTFNSSFKSTSLDFSLSHSNSTLIDCCNGLLLFYSSLTTSYHVCNLTTRKSVALPNPSQKSQISTIAFDPCHSQHFKVVNFINWHDHGAGLELFDSQSGNWVQHKVCWGVDSNALSATVRYSSGVLYLLAYPNRTIAVDLNTISCTMIELPENANYGCYVGEVGGWLNYASVSDGNQMRVWMLRDKERGEWVLKHCVSVNNMGKCRVVALHPKRDVVYINVMAEQKLVGYNVCEEKVEGVWEMGEEEKGYLVRVCVFPFTRYMEDSLARGD